ncbi:hypothetical protein HGO38_30430 [Rhizobium sp. CG5]|uniref:hypothetical protein n=1 Tax=Rhizobium sp. CG5 TaxID=2726076 RepID=UPI0020347B77|nr:hypothetical protein [Rhizobium sp. CG5]MCM2477766.1 hypothetical protein [Rhizobium sp. CG5]
MTTETTTATILPFPSHALQRPSPSPSPSPATKRSASFAALQRDEQHYDATMVQAVPDAIALCASAPPELPDASVVARVVIGFAKRKGVAMTSVPKLMRDQLAMLGAVGDPTALMLREWLEGNRRFTGGCPPATQTVSDNGECA